MRQGITENLSFRKIIVSKKADFWRGGIDLRKVRFTYKMELQFDSVVHRHFFSLRTFPVRLPEQQICGFSWALDPAAQLTFQQDCFFQPHQHGFLLPLYDCHYAHYSAKNSV